MTRTTRRRLLATAGAAATVGIAGCSGGGGGGAVQQDYIEQIQSVTEPKGGTSEVYLEIRLSEDNPADEVTVEQDSTSDTIPLSAGQTVAQARITEGASLRYEQGDVDVTVGQDGSVLQEETVSLNRSFEVVDVVFTPQDDPGAGGLGIVVNNTGDLPVKYGETEFDGETPDGDRTATRPTPMGSGGHYPQQERVASISVLSTNGSCTADNQLETTITVNAEYGESKQVNITYTLGANGYESFGATLCEGEEIDWEVVEE
jgi:hypothetical protein